MIEASARDIREAEDRGNSPGQIGALEAMWGNLLDHFGEDSTLEAVDVRSLVAYEGARRRAGRRGQTIRKEIGCVKRAFRAAREDGIAVVEPARWPTVKSDPPHPTRTGRLVPGEILRAFLAALPDFLREELTVAALTGLREAELHRLEASWVQERLLQVPAHATKNRKPRTISLPPAAWRIVAARAAATPSGPLFPRERWFGRHYLDKAAAAVGLETRITLRDLRTTYASIGVWASADAHGVQAVLGQSDLKVTQRYQRTTLARTVAVGSAVARELKIRVPSKRSPQKTRKTG